jgi:hypothetical protein
MSLKYSWTDWERYANLPDFLASLTADNKAYLDDWLKKENTTLEEVDPDEIIMVVLENMEKDLPDNAGFISVFTDIEYDEEFRIIKVWRGAHPW